MLPLSPSLLCCSCHSGEDESSDDEEEEEEGEEAAKEKEQAKEAAEAVKPARKAAHPHTATAILNNSHLARSNLAAPAATAVSSPVSAPLYGSALPHATASVIKSHAAPAHTHTDKSPTAL